MLDVRWRLLQKDSKLELGAMPAVSCSHLLFYTSMLPSSSCCHPVTADFDKVGPVQCIAYKPRHTEWPTDNFVLLSQF